MNTIELIDLAIEKLRLHGRMAVIDALALLAQAKLTCEDCVEREDEREDEIA